MSEGLTQTHCLKHYPQEALEHCADVVQIPGEFSLNVSVAGSIVLYDRLLKNGGF